MTILRRSGAPELMDSGGMPADDVARALRFLAWVNRWFGGYRLIVDCFEDWSKDWPPGAQRTVLDVGTGWADLPLALIRWSKARGCSLRITAIDSTRAVAALARENAAGLPEVEVVESDIGSFSREGRRFDYVMGSLFLHHIPRGEQAAVLGLCDAMAVRGMVFSDLRRSLPAWLAVSAVTGIFGDRITRHDGPLSVRRAFRPQELRAIALEAGLPYLKARSRPFFRLSLSGSKDRPHA